MIRLYDETTELTQSVPGTELLLTRECSNQGYVNKGVLSSILALHAPIFCCRQKRAESKTLEAKNAEQKQNRLFLSGIGCVTALRPADMFLIQEAICNPMPGVNFGPKDEATIQSA
jgi:hypothetical protein